MRTIIIPLDGSALDERALPHGRRLAMASGAEILLMAAHTGGVVSPTPTYLEEQAASLRSSADTSDLVVRTSASTSTAAVAETAIDPVIVMATRPRTGSGLGTELSATADESVVRRARCPVILVGPGCPDPATLHERSTLLVCTDGSAHSEAVVPAAMALARALRLDPIVFAVSPSGLLVARVGRPRDVASAERVAGRFRSAGLGVGCETVLDPDPAAAILEFAADRLPAFIALATHGRTGLRRVLLGSVAGDVVLHAGCPVLLVRPPSLDSRDPHRAPVIDLDHSRPSSSSHAAGHAAGVS